MREALVLSDRLSFFETFNDEGFLEQVLVDGRLKGIGGITIRVENELDVRRGAHNRYEVRTVVHRYHAWREVDGVPRDILRYDNAHDSAMHKHVFDTEGHEIRRELTGVVAPTLDEVVREAVALARR